MRQILTLLSCLLCLYSCTEKENVYVNETVIIDGNTPPPYSEVTSVQINSYVNKLYIDLLGKEPNQSALEVHVAFLKENSLSEGSRTVVIDELMNSDEYYDRFFEIYRRAYLDGVIDEDIQVELFLYNNAYDTYSQMSDPYSQALAAAILIEIEKLEKLLASASDYSNGLIEIDEFILRIAYNRIYDEINMGSENMALSCFENFLKRLPTVAELESSVEIIDGQSAQLLLQDGNDKLEFVQIITSTPEFFEGLTTDLYQRLLVRDPDSQEMTSMTAFLTQTKDYLQAHRDILITDEYAGF